MVTINLTAKSENMLITFDLNIKILYLGGQYNKEIKKNVLPKNLKILRFGYSYNQEIKKKYITTKFKKIEKNRVTVIGVLLLLLVIALKYPSNSSKKVKNHEFNPQHFF